MIVGDSSVFLSPKGAFLDINFQSMYFVYIFVTSIQKDEILILDEHENIHKRLSNLSKCDHC